MIHVLVERGVLNYDTRLVELWPEFGAHGKETATLRHVLTHSVGVPAIPADTTLEMFGDPTAMADLIAGAAWPACTPRCWTRSTGSGWFHPRG